MSDLVTITGVIGSDPRHTVTATGLPITNFRLASTRRFFDRATGAWTDGETNWYTVSSFRQLALNTARSLRKGERVVVHGRLRVRAWETGERSGTAIEIDADAIGHDLSWGVAVYSKTSGARLVETAGAEGESSNASADRVDGDGEVARTDVPDWAEGADWTVPEDADDDVEAVLAGEGAVPTPLPAS
ncbi:single-stranded DNA-binding protein [Agromyces binzhouensis]|uniref:Single-stranded DNA-binding protein n=1 Tax=Agromyces binzhouensis TaxID=1817495 RepID=A0A4Q2JBN6_9MICO|nr:single-stranded DNA-binding protein [Agromyces binzhouensis]RXZ43636.1 single-stranded DNA-binding protein [Agromyces binzhouensis]